MNLTDATLTVSNTLKGTCVVNSCAAHMEDLEVQKTSTVSTQAHAALSQRMEGSKTRSLDALRAAGELTLTTNSSHNPWS